MSKLKVSSLVCLALVLVGCGGGSEQPLGSKENPLRVMLLPVDGAARKTESDFTPMFRAMTKEHDIHFTIRVGRSYNAVVEGMANDQVDLACFGAVSYQKARKRGAVELLAVGYKGERSYYFSGIFCRKDSGLKSLKDLRGKRVAFGDPDSTSSFNVPVAMLLEAGVHPVKDLKKVMVTGSHGDSLQQLAQGLVDASCASFAEYTRFVQERVLDDKKVVPLKKSGPIPNPPFAVRARLPKELKDKLKEAFRNAHKLPGMEPGMLRGYAGRAVDGYDVEYGQKQFDEMTAKLALVTPELKSAMLRKSGQKTGS
ncbi:MAG: phosphate/phosphite/phosphonate ABC transporter substrate-binding protein [Gemmataceae bacterium]